jgi:uncharacterized membrane protein
MNASTQTPLRSRITSFILLALIIVLAALLRFYRIGALSFWLDEAYTYFVARDSLIQVIRADPNMSLFYAFAHLWLQWFPGASDGMLRMLPAFFSTGSVVAVFFLGREIASEKQKGTAIGLVSALLIAINSFHIQYAQEFRSYSLTFLLTTLSTFFLIKALKQDHPNQAWYIGYAVISAGAIYSHFYSVFLLAAQAVTLPFLFLNKPKSRQNIFPLILSFAGILVLVAPVAILAYQKGSVGIAWIPRPSMEILLDFLVKITGRSDDGRWLILLYFFLGGVGFLSGFLFNRDQDVLNRWMHLLVLSCFLVPLLLAWLISILLTPVFVDRYLLFIMPYASIMAGSGIVAFLYASCGNNGLRVTSKAVGILSVFIFVCLSAQGIRAYYADFQKDDWRTAAQFLRANCSDGLRLYYPPFVERAVLYYNSELTTQAEKWSESTNHPSGELDELITTFPAQYEKTCLVAAHVDDFLQEEQIISSIQHAYANRWDHDLGDIQIVVFTK